MLETILLRQESPDVQWFGLQTFSDTISLFQTVLLTKMTQTLQIPSDGVFPGIFSSENSF